MDAALQEQFSRVQSALETLVDSIAAYNPSTQAAGELLAADNALSRGLDQLAQHQANHRRIQSLRARADALEEQLRTSVATLAGLRRELFDTPATTFPSDSRPVPASELLLYAKNISQHTVPPTYREPVLAVPVEESKGGTPSAQATPANAALAAANDGQPSNGETTLEPATDVTVEEAEWLKKLQESNTAWVPWPSDEKIRGSNLMQIQYLIDTGQDPKLVDLTKLGEDEKENIAADAQRAADQLQHANVEPHRAHPSAHPPAAPRAPAETFGGFDFLDDDDD
ncbi:mediator of RNA polymerase II transcription subunit 4 [Periconia macrospinosa]|uniref:Mediator of RNA polymerase II transcription subunit 4 n=1 Tax=Periconia macrospinosa TaxID=97972 RepID=A0A2V1DVQ5_9PLEO|nr:mediator of RNA polymerase II transcription subunit 4 [Periconia macrospinosa]